MNNNDIIRRIRYTFDFKDSAMVEIFAAADGCVTQEQVTTWLNKETESVLSDVDLAIFLNGLINTKRGKRDGEQPQPETRLTNNMIFMKNGLKVRKNENQKKLVLLQLNRFHYFLLPANHPH